MVKSRPNLEAFRHIDDPIVIYEIFNWENHRAGLKKDLHDATFLTGKITLDESKGIEQLLNSDDKESVYLGESIIKGKTDGSITTGA